MARDGGALNLFLRGSGGGYVELRSDEVSGAVPDPEVVDPGFHQLA